MSSLQIAQSFLNRIESEWNSKWLQFIEEHIEEEWPWCDISKYLPWSFMEKYPTHGWHLDSLDFNSPVAFQVIESNLCEDFDNDFWWWSWEDISLHPNVTLDVIQRNLDQPWDWKALSSSSKITPEFVRSHPHLPWDREELSRNPKITGQASNQTLPSNWTHLSETERILSEPRLSENPNLTPDEIRKNLDWDWEELSSHPNLTMDIVEENPDKDWSWANLLVHPNITLEFASAHLDKDWQADSFFPNLAVNGKKNYLEKRKREYLHLFSSVSLLFKRRNIPPELIGLVMEHL